MLIAEKFIMDLIKSYNKHSSVSTEMTALGIHLRLVSF